MLTFIVGHKWLILLWFFTIINIARLTAIADKVFILYSIVGLAYSLHFYWEKSDKVILVFLFFYLVSSFIFYYLLKSESKEPIYNPAYKKNFVGYKSEYKLSAILRQGEQSWDCYLTNWSERGAFIYIISDQYSSIRGKVKLDIIFNKTNFTNQGVLRTCYDSGYGIVFENSNDELNWKSFFRIINDRGYQPRFV